MGVVEASRYFFGRKTEKLSDNDDRQESDRQESVVPMDLHADDVDRSVSVRAC